METQQIQTIRAELEQALAKARKSGVREREAWLARELEQFDRHHPPPKVFVSFNSKHRKRQKNLYKGLINALDRAGFEVVTSLGPGEVVEDIVERIRRCSILLSVMGDAVHLEDGSASPGFWVIAELGMAMAMRKPFVIFKHKDIARDYWDFDRSLHPPTFSGDEFGQVDTVIDLIMRDYARLGR